MVKHNVLKMLGVCLLVGILFYFGSTFLFASNTSGSATPFSSGQTLLSVSSYNSNTTSPYLKGSVTELTVIVDNSGGTLTFSGTGLNGLPWTMTATMQNPQCVYALTENPSQTFNTGVAYAGNPPTFGQSTPSSSLYYNNQNGLNVGYLIGQPVNSPPVQNYVVQTISTVPMITYTILFTATNSNGTIASLVINPNTNQGYLVDQFGNFYGYVQLLGNLQGSLYCPQPAINQIVLRQTGVPPSSSSYIVASLSAYNQWKSYQFGNGQVSQQVISNVISQYNQLMLNVLQPVQTETACNFFVTNSSLLVCSPIAPPVTPLIRIDVSNSFIGTNTPTSSWYITGLSTVQITARNNTALGFTLSNIGKSQGSAQVSLNCNSNSVNSTTTTDQVGVNQSVTDSIYVIGQAGVYLCQLTATDVGNPSSMTTLNVQIQIFKPQCIYGCCVGLPDFADKTCPSQTFGYLDQNNNTVISVDNGQCQPVTLQAQGQQGYYCNYPSESLIQGSNNNVNSSSIVLIGTNNATVVNQQIQQQNSIQAIGQTSVNPQPKTTNSTSSYVPFGFGLFGFIVTLFFYNKLAK